MNNNCDYHATISNSINGREEIEWANFWYSNANSTTEGGKYLLIGDSTGRKIRSSLEKTSGKPVDFLGTSAGLHDLLFWSQMNSFFAPVTWEYDVIYVWLGYHSLKNERGEYYCEDDFLLFDSDIRNILAFLEQYSKRVILCSALYPVEKKDNPNKLDILWFHLKPLCRLFKEKIVTEEAAVIEKKNKIIQSVAREKGVTYCDINKYMLSLCENYRTRCVHFDKIHYEGKAFPLQVRFLLECAGR